jgi:5'-nucleotidase
MRFKALRVAVAAVVALSLAVPAQASPRSDQPVSLGGKKVLLVNDDSVQSAKPDGSDGRGIYVLRQALCRAGADVAIVGPWTAQGGKGRSTAVSFTSSVAPPSAVPAEFAADCAGAPGHGLVLGACQGGTPCGPGSASLTPADVTELALTGILPQRLGWTTGPDLVLSGVNAGQNTGIPISMSGTVGAASVAIERGIPAVAVSAGSSATPPSTETYAAAADVVIRLLASPRTWKFVQDMALVNVNQPDVAPGSGPSPVRWTKVSRVASGWVKYVPAADGTYQLSYDVVPAPAYEADSDAKALLDGYVSVSVVAVDRGYLGRLRG